MTSRRRPPSEESNDVLLEDAREMLDILSSEVGLPMEEPIDALLTPAGLLSEGRLVQPGLVDDGSHTFVNRSGHDSRIAKNDGSWQAPTQKVTAASDVLSNVPSDQVDERKRPSKEYGKAVIKLAKSAGWSEKDLANEIGKSLSTIERLPQGKGSLEVGLLVKEALRRKNIDVSALPPLPTADLDEEMPEWKREWLWIGETLSEHANADWWRAMYEDLRQRAEVFDRQARDLAALGNPK